MPFNYLVYSSLYLLIWFQTDWSVVSYKFSSDNMGSFQIQLLFIKLFFHVINNLKQRFATLIVVYGKDPDLNANKLLVTGICLRPPPLLSSPCNGIWSADQSSVQLNKFINGENLDRFLFVNLISDNLFAGKNLSNNLLTCLYILKTNKYIDI